MDAFEERERDFEARFKHDQDVQFRVKARRNRLIGLWVAGLIGLTGDAAQAYAAEIVEAEFAGGDRHVIEKICADLNAKGLSAKGESCTPARIEFELTHFAETARQQVMRE